MLLTSSVDFSAAAPTTPSQASSTAILSGSSMAFPPAASTSPSISGAKHGTNTSVAIAFGAVAVAAFLIAIVAWFVRIRARSRRRNISKRTAWPWDNGDQHLESVHGVLSSYEKDEESEGEAPSLHSVLTLPPELVGRDEIMHGTHYIPMPQSPYRLTGDLHKSVPDLAPDMGTLRVANYVPGDSRATSRLGMTLTGHPSSTEGPNPSLDDFAMLKQPWPSLRADSGESAFALASIDEKSDPYYFSSDMHSQGPTTRAQPPDSWVSSWKSNIMHAFQAVVSGSSSTTPSGDKYTVEPTRVGQASSRQQVLSRQNSVQSQSAISRHNSTSGHSVHGSNKDPSAWHAEAAYNRRDRSSDLSVPPLAIVKNRDRHCGTLSRASSVYSTASASCTEPALPISGFGLPQIPTSQSGSLSSLQHAFQGNDLDDAQVTAESVEASGWRRHRALSTSAHSVMSSLSRTASSQSEVLTDQEQYARGVLKERIHSISNVKLSGSDDVASHR
ncbi:hypothetical protein BC835DRAFT_426845 [Cytidiella melzeri]|nr:hypothetical protein BC835DRAFT_426845 [Cytidiella melzeri]